MQSNRLDLTRWFTVINLLRASINKTNTEWYAGFCCWKHPVLSFLPFWILTLFLGYWLTVQCLECCSCCRVSRIIDKPQGSHPWMRMAGLSKQPWQTLTSTSTVSQGCEGKIHLGRAIWEVFSLKYFPLQKKLQCRTETI